VLLQLKKTWKYTAMYGLCSFNEGKTGKRKTLWSPPAAIYPVLISLPEPADTELPTSPAPPLISPPRPNQSTKPAHGLLVVVPREAARSHGFPAGAKHRDHSDRRRRRRRHRRGRRLPPPPIQEAQGYGVWTCIHTTILVVRMRDASVSCKIWLPMGSALSLAPVELVC